MHKFMKTAIKEALNGLHGNDGGPFGAVIVRNGKIIAKGHNEVIKTNDPTAHAEIVAIRQASARLRRFDLSDCTIYATCEPCPMCLSAIYWSRIKKIYYGCTKEDAAAIGFDDKFIYDIIRSPSSRARNKMKQINRQDCLKLMEAWELKEDRIPY
jgi:guanine deaminase